MISAPLKKVLIVDDDLAIRRLIELCLRNLPVGQVAVSEGKSALAVMRREKVDLVVTDLMMPETSGFDIIRSMRADPLLRDVPVVLLSCLGNPALPAQAEAAGVQAYFPKPFSPSQLIGTVRQLLGL
jgi:CheY-like chemotaxis protein